MATAKRPLEKRILASPVTQTLTGAALRAYRALIFGTCFLDQDPAFRAFLDTDEPAIFAVWHQDFVMSLGYLSRWNPRRRSYALASGSRDGGIAAAAAMGMGFRSPIRGSSGRGGKRALLGLTRLLRDERDVSLAVVVDGPRPPAREMKAGVVHLASHSNRPIWLLRTTASPQRIASRSWARFHLPLPFQTVVVRAEGPIHVPRDLGREATEHWRLEVEGRLNALADRTDARALELTSRR